MEEADMDNAVRLVLRGFSALTKKQRAEALREIQSFDAKGTFTSEAIDAGATGPVGGLCPCCGRV